MAHCVFGIVMVIALFAGVTPGWGQHYLYAPKPVAAEEKFQKKDGVLVQEVPVKKGDTLSAISRRFSGHSSYFPQILLFNDIKNPDRIYAGNRIKVPVSRSGATDQSAKHLAQSRVPDAATAGPASGISTGKLKQGTAVKKKKRDTKHKASAPAYNHDRSAKQPPAAVAASEQRLFERAVKAYRQDDCRTALELFDRFLTEHPSSALAADASLYKAECYLKLSNQ